MVKATPNAVERATPKADASRWSAPSYWRRELRRFFHPRADALDQVFEADGCREGWLQGEMFLHFHGRRGPMVRFNHQALKDGCKADIAAYRPSVETKDGKERSVQSLVMVGELKMLKVDYQEKNLTGRHADAKLLRERLEKSRRRTFLIRDDAGTNLSVSYKHKSLYRDYIRLVTFESLPPVVRVLVLVLNLRGTENDAGFLLKKVKFEQKSYVLLKTDTLLVKAWFLRERHHKREVA
jgi:hypothetical protein